MSDISKALDVLIRRVLESDGKAPQADRKKAFDNSDISGPTGALIAKVANHAYRVTDEDIADSRSSSLSEDQIFELVVCAAIGQALRQYNGAVAALQTAAAEE